MYIGEDDVFSFGMEKGQELVPNIHPEGAHSGLVLCWTDYTVVGQSDNDTKSHSNAVAVLTY